MRYLTYRPIDLFYINHVIKVFIQNKILCLRLNFYVYNKCVNKPLQNGYSSREGTMCILVY